MIDRLVDKAYYYVRHEMPIMYIRNYFRTRSQEKEIDRYRAENSIIRQQGRQIVDLVTKEWL